MLKIAIETILLGFLPALMIFLGKDSHVWEWLKSAGVLSQTYDYTIVQFWVFCVGFFVGALVLPIKYALVKKARQKREEVLRGLLAANKDVQLQLLKTKLGLSSTEFKTRIFKPRIHIFSLKRYLRLKEYGGISDPFHSTGLAFRIGDQPEGVAGKAFKEKKMVVDFNLEDQNTYHLNESQQIKIGKIKFCAAIPIFDENNNNVKGVVSIDSTQKINLDATKQKELIDQLKFYTAFVVKHI